MKNDDFEMKLRSVYFNYSEAQNYLRAISILGELSKECLRQMRAKEDKKREERNLKIPFKE